MVSIFNTVNSVDIVQNFQFVIVNKGSCTYYVITFGGPERPPPPYVIL